MTGTAGGRRALELALLVLLALPVLFLGLASYSVVNGDEAIYHTIAARMLATGEWTRLAYHGQDRVYDAFMNAPTQYLLRAGLIAALGDNLWSMRLLSAAGGLAAALLAWRLARELEGDGGGRWSPGPLFAGLVVLTSFQLVYLHGARTGELDALVSAELAAVLLLFLRGARDGRSFLPHHLALALLFTTKAPLVLVPLAAELLWLAATPSARGELRRYARAGIAVAPLALAWHAWQAATRWSDFAAVARKMSGEAGGEVGGGDYTGGPLANLAWYVERAFHGLFPWSLAAPAAVLALLLARRSGGEVDERARSARRATLLFAACTWLFFLAVSKRYPWYVMPSYPLLAALVGAWVGRVWRAPRALDLALGALAVGAMPFVHVPLAGVRPLVERAARFPMDAFFVPLGPLSPAAGIPLVAAAVAVALLVLRRGLGERAGPSVVLVAFAPLLAVAAVRVALPLGTLAHTSALEELHRRVEDDLAAGRPVRWPLAVPESEGWLRVQYYFGERYLARTDGGRILIEGRKPGARGR